MTSVCFSLHPESWIRYRSRPRCTRVLEKCVYLSNPIEISRICANGSIREGIGSFSRNFLWFKNASRTKKKALRAISRIWKRNSDTSRPRLRRRRTTSTKFSTGGGDESETAMIRGSDGDEEGRSIAGEERKRADERNERNERDEGNECQNELDRNTFIPFAEMESSADR